MSKTCVRVEFQMAEEGKPDTKLISNDEEIAARFWTAVAKNIVVGEPNHGTGSPRFFMFHEEEV